MILQESKLNNYFDEIGAMTQRKKHSRQQIRTLIAKAQKGSKSARNKVIEHNLRLVIFVAKKLKTSAMSLEDRIAYGNIGLFSAIDKFDLERGTEFSTYAVPWIRQSITRALDDYSALIRKPCYMIYKILKYLKIQSSFPRATYEEMAKKMKITKKEAKRIHSSAFLPILPFMLIGIPTTIS